VAKQVAHTSRKKLNPKIWSQSDAGTSACWLDEGKQATGFLLHLDGWEWNPSTRIHGDA
jgi:hypothetical protein